LFCLWGGGRAFGAHNKKKHTAGKGHEGGVEGPNARKIVFMMISKLKREGYPKKSEGLQSVLVCRSHKEIEDALELWKTMPTEPFDAEAALRTK